MNWSTLRLFFRCHPTSSPPLLLISSIAGGKHRPFLWGTPFSIQSSSSSSFFSPWCQCTKSSIVPHLLMRFSSATVSASHAVTPLRTIQNEVLLACNLQRGWLPLRQERWKVARRIGMGDCSYYILYTRNKLAVRVLSLAGGGGLIILLLLPIERLPLKEEKQVWSKDDDNKCLYHVSFPLAGCWWWAWQQKAQKMGNGSKTVG